MDDSRGVVALTVDGEPVSVGADGGFVARRSLSPGRNTLAFVAVDAAGNPTMKSVDVTAAGPIPAAAAGAVESADATSLAGRGRVLLSASAIAATGP